MMDANQLKDTLKKLHATLEKNGQVDAELKQLLQVLDSDIQRLVGQGADDSSGGEEGLAERAQAISAQFAAQYPRLEPMLRELAAILERMGI